MASPDGGGKDEIKTQFTAREGTYKLMPLSEYSRPNKTTFNGQANSPVRTSFIHVDGGMFGEVLCFNVGRELYVYPYKGVRKAADLTKPIDKRIYKGTNPTCHDFNTLTAREDSLMCLVGFTAGQLQLIDPCRKELSKLYNEERNIEKTKVTCIRWIPGSPNQFLASYTSGMLYVYNEELSSGVMPPVYQMFKHGEGFSVFTCKTKSSRNPLYRWAIGSGAIHEFAFSSCSKYLAVVSQDGHLRVFDYDSMELVGTMRSYFGGLLCCCWSPDGKYIVTGGEDDMVTVWSFHEKRVVCRGHGHKSWVNAVAFDPFTTILNTCDNGYDFSGSDDDFRSAHGVLNEQLRLSSRSSQSRGSRSSTDSRGLGAIEADNMITYRFGSIGQDTQLCLWDLTDEILRQPIARQRTSTLFTTGTTNISNNSSNTVLSNSTVLSKDSSVNTMLSDSSNSTTLPQTSNKSSSSSLTHKFATLALGERSSSHKESHKRNFSLSKSNSSDKSSSSHKSSSHFYLQPQVNDDSIRLLGTPCCPRLPEVTMLEPIVCKKISSERLTGLVFKEDCIVLSCQEGNINTWARPGKYTLTTSHQVSPPHHLHTHHGTTAL